MPTTRISSGNVQQVPVNVVGASNFGRYSKISNERTYNMFISDSGHQPDDPNYEQWLVNFPGYQRVLDIEPPGSGRGLFNCIRGDFAIIVINATVYRLNPDFTLITIGDLATQAGEVFIADNLNAQICIVDGLNAYIYNYSQGPNLTIQTNGALGSGALIPDYVEYHNTFFLFGNGNTTAAGAFWYAYSPATASAIGNITILGTGVLAPTELLINGTDVAGTYTTVAAFVNYINSGPVLGVTASNAGAAVTLYSANTITLSTAGTVGANGITFANFSTTGGALTEVFGVPSPDMIVQTTQLALQTKADFALAVKRIPGQGNNVIVFGSTVSEIWTNVGGLANYVRNPTKNINYGCLSTSTIGEGGDILAWLATNQDESPIIMAYMGNELRKISTDGIDYQLDHLVAPQTSTALLYHSSGHLFYQLTFFDPRDNLTILYDFNTHMFFHLSDHKFNYHPARAIMYFTLNTYFLSLNTGSLYQLSSNFTTINENIAPANDPNLIFTMQRERITKSVRMAGAVRYVANSLALTLEQGTDLQFMQATVDQIVGQNIIAENGDNIIAEGGQQLIIENALDANYANNGDYAYAYPPYDQIFYQPRIDLSFSKDGGISWSSIVPHGLNPLGQYQNECHWEGMGIANDLMFKFSFIGQYRFVVNNAVLDIVM